MTFVESNTSFSSENSAQTAFRSDLGQLYVHNGTNWLNVLTLLNGGGALSLVESKDITSNTQEVSFSTNIDGDNDRFYVAFIKMVHGSGGNDEMDLRFNSDTGNNYNRVDLTGNGSSAASSNASSQSSIKLVNNNNGQTSFAVVFISAVSGDKRNAISLFLQEVANVGINSGQWTNTANNITSIQFRSTGANNIGSGSKIDLFKIHLDAQ